MIVSETTSQVSTLPQIATGLPIIGTIDLSNPIEWVWIAGLAFDLIYVQGISKWVIAAGIIAARYEVQQGKWLNFT